MIAVMVVTAALLLVISALTVKAEDSWISEASASLSGDGNASSYPFSGTFDGGGHTIKNITIYDSAAKRSQGLFGYSDGTIWSQMEHSTKTVNLPLR